MMKKVTSHYPVMYRDVINCIQSFRHIRKLSIADCNFGLGGHSHKIIKQFPNSSIDGFEIDKRVIQHYKQNYEHNLTQQQKKRINIHHSNFNALTNFTQNFDIILADLGFNTFHLQNANGFSWRKDTPLDMRYSQSHQPESQAKTTALKCSQIINHTSQIELYDILRKFGQLKEASAVAKKIIQSRPIKTTFQLRDSIVGVFQNDKTRKIAQTFQAMRIVTNGELQDLSKLCDAIKARLSPKGMAMIITFHSVQRNLINGFLKQEGRAFKGTKILQPSSQELKQNKPSSSAKIIVFSKQ